MDQTPTEPRPDRPRSHRWLRRAGMLAGTAVVAAISLAAVQLATRAIAAGTERIAVAAPSAALTVATTRVAIQDSYAVRQEFIGRVEPRQDSTLGFEIGGTVDSLLADEGDRVAAGQVLAALDLRLTRAQIAEARAARDALSAQLELARLTWDRQQALADRSFASRQTADEARLAVAELEARIAQTDATVAQAEVQLDKGVLRAPYDGRIARRHVDAGATVTGTAPVFDLQEDAAPQLRVGLLPGLAAGLTPGAGFDVTIEGRPYRATYVSRQAAIDPVTRTLPVLFDLAGDGAALPYGAVVRLSVMRDIPERGAWLPLTALAEGPRGLWTVMLVDSDGTVRREAVEVIHAEGARAYVRGALAEGEAVVRDGTHRITEGQPVLMAEG